jgi:putative oxidoreductase
MNMTTIQESMITGNRPIRQIVGLAQQLARLADRIPLSLVQLAARLAVAHVFWASAQTKLASFQVTEQLFAYEYQLPLLDPAFAARLATATELIGSLLLAFGLASRIGALMLLGVTAVIQIFVFPQSWPEHFVWASLLLLVLARGGGVFSADYLISRYFAGRN